MLAQAGIQVFQAKALGASLRWHDTLELLQLLTVTKATLPSTTRRRCVCLKCESLLSKSYPQFLWITLLITYRETSSSKQTKGETD
jgi:hypothetical protein